MEMRRIGMAIATILVAALLAGCGLRTFEARFAGDGMVQALPVTVDDRTGLVTGVMSLVGGAGGWENAATNPFGRPDQLDVSWLGGMCDRHVTLVVEPSGDEFVIRVSTERADACLLAGILRSVRIAFSAPISADLVHLKSDD